jgi:hypothetical protein
MMAGPVSRVELVARRRPDLDQGYLDYGVYAGEQLVGRIYQMRSDQWTWAINTVMIDATAGAGMSGHAASMSQAQAALRLAFNRWCDWALAMPESDLKYGPLDRNLKAIGLR